MFVDMISSKKPNPVGTELFIRGRKLIISIVFVTQSYLNSIFFLMEIPYKRGLQQITIRNSSDIDSKDFMKIKHFL